VSHRPYPNAERALHQLARKERVTHRVFATPGGIGEEHVFPGQSFGAVFANIRRHEPALTARLQEVGRVLSSTTRPVVGARR